MKEDMLEISTRTPRRAESRESETRAALKRPAKWMPPQMLPDPHPEEGYAFRWIRVSTLNEADPMNVSAKLREGWEPVKASDHPEVQVMPGASKAYPDSIVVGGLMLCKTPVEFVEQRNAYYTGQADAQMHSVDNNYLRENDPRMPLFKERKTTVTFGSGT